jgi:Carbohydrate-binding module 48 (Isoamylase N-terminal domain)
MDETEALLNRFVDNELSRSERLKLLYRVDRERSLLQRVIELEQVTVHSAALPRLGPGPDFTGKVLGRLPRGTTGRRFFSPKTYPLPFSGQFGRSLQAASVAAIALALGWFLGGHMSFYGFPKVGPAPAEHSVYIRFALPHPAAKSVSVVGDFNDWNPHIMPLQQTTDGFWTLTVPVKAGRYDYLYVVDSSVWVSDPYASEHSVDGFGTENSVLDVGEAL